MSTAIEIDSRREVLSDQWTRGCCIDRLSSHCFSDGMRRPVSGGMRYAPNGRRARSATETRPAMKKTITVQAFHNDIFKQQKLTIGLDLGDRWSFYCVLEEAGQVILE